MGKSFKCQNLSNFPTIMVVQDRRKKLFSASDSLTEIVSRVVLTRYISCFHRSSCGFSNRRGCHIYVRAHGLACQLTILVLLGDMIHATSVPYGSISR